jgi:putative transcriptional regulator
MIVAMRNPFRILLALLLLAALASPARAQDDDAMLLVAHPAFRDMDYRQTVLLAAPAPNGGHVGVILNRPTRRSLASLFPEHEPSKKVIDPVNYGGPFSRGALVAIVRGDTAPGNGTVPLMKNLYMAFRANTIDQIIESKPNDARYYVGYVGWRPGELKTELDRGIWSVLGADADVIFRKDMENLWEELLMQTRRIRANTGTDHVFAASSATRKTWSVPEFQAAALTGAFSNAILPPR